LKLFNQTACGQGLYSSSRTGNGSQVHPHTNQTLTTHNTNNENVTDAFQQGTHNRVIENRNQKKNSENQETLTWNQQRKQMYLTHALFP